MIILDCCPFKISKMTNAYPSLQPFKKYFKHVMNSSKEHSLLVRMKKSMVYGEWNNLNIVVLNVF